MFSTQFIKKIRKKMLKEIRKKTQFLGNNRNRVSDFRLGLNRVFEIWILGLTGSDPDHNFRYPKKRVPEFPDPG